MVDSGRASNNRVHINQYGSLSECRSNMLRIHLFFCMSVIFRGNTIHCLLLCAVHTNIQKDRKEL